MKTKDNIIMKTIKNFLFEAAQTSNAKQLADKFTKLSGLKLRYEGTSGYDDENENFSFVDTTEFEAAMKAGDVEGGVDLLNVIFTNDGSDKFMLFLENVAIIITKNAKHTYVEYNDEEDGEVNFLPLKDANLYNKENIIKALENMYADDYSWSKKNILK